MDNDTTTRTHPDQATTIIAVRHAAARRVAQSVFVAQATDDREFRFNFHPQKGGGVFYSLSGLASREAVIERMQQSDLTPARDWMANAWRENMAVEDSMNDLMAMWEIHNTLDYLWAPRDYHDGDGCTVAHLPTRSVSVD